MRTVAVVLIAFIAASSLCVREAYAQDEEKYQFPPNIHRCVWAGNKLRKAGDGSTIESCSSCDPARPECAPGCQELIDTIYRACDGICLPDGYYFDPGMLSCSIRERV
jgi:hypothetical protein